MVVFCPAFANCKLSNTKGYRYGSSNDMAWQVYEVPDTPLHVSVHRKDAEKRGAARRVLVLYPRPSSAYDIAITTILDVFETKEINADVTAVNFETDDQMGEDPLKLAQDAKYARILSMGSTSPPCRS